MTLGNVIVTDIAPERFAADKALAHHETSHASQSALLGNDLYAFEWLFGLGVSAVFGQAKGGGGCLNPIEWAAGPGGGYETLCS